MSDIKRLSIPCYNCNGKGFHPLYVDDDGQGHLDECRLCYRGTITVKLKDQDLLNLQKQIAELLSE